MKIKRLKKILTKSIPLWLVLVLIIDSSFLLWIGQYYLTKKELKISIGRLAKSTNNPDQLIQIIKQEVLPSKGYTTSLKWKSLGKELVEAGAIDKEKYEQIFTSEANGKEEMKYLEGNFKDNITINEKNSRFIVNTFWALGLINKSKVLDEGPMRGEGVETGNMASTGGWTLGKKGAMELYSSRKIIPLTDEQQELVRKIAEGVFRPCCGNSTAFPDCNHGMAALGYIELAVFNGLSEKQIYKDLLAFNSFWFPQNYVEMAVYLERQGSNWKDVDAKVALSFDYSSALGAQKIRQAVQNVPGLQSQGGGCGA